MADIPIGILGFAVRASLKNLKNITKIDNNGLASYITFIYDGNHYELELYSDNGLYKRSFGLGGDEMSEELSDIILDIEESAIEKYNS